MKKYLIILLAFIATSAATSTAQSIYYGPKAGINLSNLSQTSNAKARVRGTIGGFAGYQVTDILAIQVEALYSWQGTKINFVDIVDSKLSLDYFKIPVLGKLAIVDNLSAEAGVSFNFLTSALLNGKAHKGMNSFDLSLPIGASYRFMENFEVGLRYDISLINVGLVGSSTSKNSNWFLSLAYRF